MNSDYWSFNFLYKQRMNQTILDFIMIASVIIGYFVSISLITSSFYKSRANNYLALSLLLISSLTFLEWPRVSMENMFFQFLSNIRLDFLFATTFFTYFLIQINHKLINKNWYKRMYFPFLCSLILEILITFFDYILNIYSSFFDILIYLSIDIASTSLNVFLIFWGRRLINKSDTISEDKRRWLLRLNLFIISIIVIWILAKIEFLVNNSSYARYMLWIQLSLFSWWILYYGVFKLQIITQKEEIHDYLVSKKTASIATKKKIKSSTTSKIITQLYKLMEDEELYKNPLLSRLDLATRLETSEGYLSQIINQEINKSVIQFVNEYRIEAAKNLLQNPVFKKYSIEAIGMEAGFKSKSAFYNVFKTSLDMSPGAYRKLQITS